MTTEKTEERKPIREIRNDKNSLLVKADVKWPNMYGISREKGQIPGELKGLYTSKALADQAVTNYLAN